MSVKVNGLVGLNHLVQGAFDLLTKLATLIWKRFKFEMSIEKSNFLIIISQMENGNQRSIC